MLNTILFDLDGTLLPIDIDRFMHIYFKEMGIALHDMIDPKELVDKVWKATGAMVNNTENKTNEEVFMDTFGNLINGDLEKYKERFNAFYDAGFLKTKESTSRLQIIADAVEMLKSKGYEMILATNPIFPKKAILHRLQWAGFSPDDFRYITSYETNHYCKPQLHFYEEILKDNGKTPAECMMVGNDVEEDLVAGKLGLQTYLITNHIITRDDLEICCTHKGNYEDFYRFVQGLPTVK